MFPGVKFGIACLLILQLIAVIMHILLTTQILMIGQANFQVDPVWLQPLIVLILMTDGGGFVLMFIFESSEVTWLTYRRFCYGLWIRLAGRTPERELEEYAFRMATSPDLMDTSNRSSRTDNAFSGCAAVDWMLTYGGFMSRDEAQAICTQLMGKELLVPIADQPRISFVDAEDYRYNINLPSLRGKSANVVREHEVTQKVLTMAKTFNLDDAPPPIPDTSASSLPSIASMPSIPAEAEAQCPAPEQDVEAPDLSSAPFCTPQKVDAPAPSAWRQRVVDVATSASI